MKKILIYIGIIIGMIACNNDDTSSKTINDFKVSFVYDDGTAIAQGACIEPDGKYALAIQGFQLNQFNPEVKYVLNGVNYTTSFTKEETQIIPVTLVAGQNVIQVAESSVKASLYYPVQGGFELVE